MDLIRHELIHRVAMTLRDYPVTALLGPRQCGKTTIARDFARRHRAEYFDLEDPVSLRRLSDPLRALSHVRGLIVIDEIQRSPELFPILRVLADRHPLPARFLVLGCASPDLLRQSSESLAERDIREFGVQIAAPLFRRFWSMLAHNPGVLHALLETPSMGMLEGHPKSRTRSAPPTRL